MSTSLGDLLPKHRFEEPPEVRAIKAFIEEQYQQPAGVSIRQQQIIIHVKSAALAGALRLRLHELREQCQTDRRLVIRIDGS